VISISSQWTLSESNSPYVEVDAAAVFNCLRDTIFEIELNNVI